MKILVNGTLCDTTATDLAAALKDLGYGGSTVATAVNGEFVPVSLRPDSPLAEGDRLEVLAPMQGG